MRSGQSGFSMVEALVAFIVLSFSIVGLMGLQGYGLQMTTSSMNRIKATLLSQDIVERMRSNMPSVGTGAYDMGAGATATAVSSCKTTNGCSSAQMAQNDLYEWGASVASQLNGGEVAVCIDSTPNDGTGATDAACDGTGIYYVAKIWWNDEKNATNKKQFVFAFRP